MAIVGESGSGKSVTSLAIMGLHPETAKITGSITLHGDELLSRNEESMSRLRGESISMIFQDPLSALTPVYSIGDQIVEAIQVHHDVSKAAATKRPSSCSTWWAFPTRSSGSSRSPMSSPAACGNGR